MLPSGDQILFGEVWDDLNTNNLGFEMIIPGLYSISTFGRLYNTATKRFLPQDNEYHKNKYITLCLKLQDGNSQFFMLHRLMCMQYFPRYDYREMEVNHIDGIKYHNWIWNLEWMTPLENTRHAFSNGLVSLGEERGNASLTNEQAEFICELIAKGKGYKDVVDIMNNKYPETRNLKIDRIYFNIRGGLSWKHVSCKYTFPQI